MGRVLYLCLMMSIQKIKKKEDLNTNSENDLLIKKIRNQNQRNMEIRSRKKIHLVTDSSEESDSIKTKDYDPDIYPEGTLQDIRDDEGDKCHSRSFVSMSDDEGTKERKENRSEYIRKRVARKRKHRGKIDDNLKLTKFSHKIMYF